MDDIVLLDSDEEDKKVNVDANKNLSSDKEKSEEGASTAIAMNNAGEDDIVVEYNHNDYADLVGPLKSSNGVTGSVKPTPPAPTITSGPPRLPKRPGSMPPFALFSQEMRAKLQKEDPDIGFGDLGRKLGEMWHALKEEEKEDYRKKARQVAEQRMRSYNDAMRKMSPQKRAMLENQQRMQMNKIKKKRTSGYSIFCSEYRRKLAQEQPDLPFADISKTVADDWKLLSGEKRQSYEMRAQRFNTEEERKWRQRMVSQQNQQARIRQMSPSGRGRGGMVTGRGGSTVYRNILPNSQRGRTHMSMASRRGQYNPGARGQNNQSGLVIASVSSLSSSSSTSQSNYNLPSGISISKSADPDINLPKSISISRVEPDIQIVEESITNKPQQTQHRMMGTTVVTRGRGVSLRGRGGQIRPTLAARGVPINTRGRMPYSRGRAPIIGGRGGMMISSRGRGMAINSPVRRIIPGNVSPMNAMSPGKRMGSVMVNPNPMKRPRMPLNNQSSYNVPGAVNQATLDLVGRLCRICGVSSPIIFRLNDRRELLSKISQVLNLDLDLEADVQNSYPGVICRKCTNLVETFHNFQLTVTEGQKTLVKQVEASKARKAAAAARVDMQEEILVDEPESIGVDPLESIGIGAEDPDDLNSILPDTELDTESFLIKEEKIGGSSDSTHNTVAVTSTSKSVVTTSATSSSVAPMTAVFTEAVSDMTTIKVEPDITSIKREASDEAESSDKLSPFDNIKSIEITPISEEKTDKDLSCESKDEEHSSEKNANDSNKSPVKSVSEALDDISKTIDDATKKVLEEKKADLEPEPEKSVNSSLNQTESEDSTEPPDEEKTEPEQDNEEASGVKDLEKSDDTNSKPLDGNEDFGGLFSDYPSWQNEDSQEAGNGEDNVEDIDWMPGEDELGNIEDTPVMEVRTMNGDEFDALDGGISDPLFEMEEGGEDLPENGDADFGHLDTMEGLETEDTESPKDDPEKDSSDLPPDVDNEEQMLGDNDMFSEESGLSEQHPDDSGTDNVETEENIDNVNTEADDEADGHREICEDNLNEDCDVGIESTDASEETESVGNQ